MIIGENTNKVYFFKGFQVGFHLGALNTLAKILIECFGCNGTLIDNNAFVVIATIWQQMAKSFDNYIYMMISRFFIGFNSGINMGLASIYLSEIAPMNLRGEMGCMSNVFLYTVFLFALIVGLSFTLGDEENWHLIFLLSYIPVSVQLTLLSFFCPESPKYSDIVRGNFMEAERSLQLLIGRNDVTTIVSTNASGGCLAAYLSIVFIAVYVVFFSFGFVAITETYLSNNKTYYKS
uniref:Major facilitator superfamily (MFS) profile domain-containing protein n=1 Tax=Meloidogyne incognita TaxID=6306 RepID=A0A914NTI3_MELIC